MSLSVPVAIANGGTGAATVSPNTVFGNATGSTAAPGFTTNPVVTSQTFVGSTSGSSTLSTDAASNGIVVGGTFCSTCLDIWNPNYFPATSNITFAGSGYHTIINGLLNGTNGGTGNLAVGCTITANNSGQSFNTCIGPQASISGGSGAGGGYDSLAVGYLAKIQDDSGNSSAVGISSVVKGAGRYNNAFGYNAVVNSSGNNDTAIGSNATYTGSGTDQIVIGDSSATIQFPGSGGVTLGLGVHQNCTHGSNATCGVVALSSGTVTVSTTAIATLATSGGAGDAVRLTMQGACTGNPYVGTVSSGTSFVINSTVLTDSCNVFWEIVVIN